MSSTVSRPDLSGQVKDTGGTIKLEYMLDVRRMQMLAAVVSNGSVTAAAARLGYTPSAISQQVAALEKEAGTELLERVGRGVRPTAAGLLLTEYADAIGRQVAEAETALGDLLAGRTGGFRCATSPRPEPVWSPPRWRGCGPNTPAYRST